MTQQRHSELSIGNIHKIHQWDKADTTARDALSVTSADIGKVCKVGTDLYWLSSVSPSVWSSMGSGGGTVSYSAESDDTLVKGNAIYVKGTGHIALAASSTSPSFSCIGLALAAVAPTFSATYQTYGKFTLADWTSIIGSASLIVSANYFLDSVAGKLTETPSLSTGYLVEIGKALSATELGINISHPIKL